MHSQIPFLKHLKIQSVLLACALSTMASLGACHPVDSNSPTKTSTAEKINGVSGRPVPGDPTGEMRTHGLTLYGYNYTDTSISSYEVNGNGGGNIDLSFEHGGGGSSTCCYKLFTPISEGKTVKVKWLRYRGDQGYWCEQVVPLKGPAPAKPEYLEVHFYRDGHIEVAVTEDYSPPRIILPEGVGGSRNANKALNVNNDEKFSTCERWIEPGSKEYRALADKAAAEARAEEAKAAKAKKK